MQENAREQKHRYLIGVHRGEGLIIPCINLWYTAAIIIRRTTSEDGARIFVRPESDKMGIPGVSLMRAALFQ